MQFAMIFMFDIDVVRADCIAGAMSSRYVLQGLLPLFPGIVYFLVSLNPVWKDRAYNVIGVFYSIAYIFLCRVSFKIFECADVHPNAPSTLAQFPDVYCGEDERTGLVWFGVLLFLVYPIGLPAVFSLLCYIAPNHFHDDSFRMRTTFLLGRWRPSAWWFSPVFMLRSFLVSATLFVYPMEGSMQLTSAAVVQGFYLMVLCLLMPYRGFRLNATDATITLSIQCICSYALGIGVVSTDLDVERRIMDYGVFFALSFVIAAGVPLVWVIRMTLCSYMYKQPASNTEMLNKAVDTIKTFKAAEIDDRVLSMGLKTMLSEDERSNLHQTLSVVIREVCEQECSSPKKRLFINQAKPQQAPSAKSKGGPASPMPVEHLPGGPEAAVIDPTRVE